MDGEDGVLIGDCVLLRVLPDAFECEYSDVCSSFLLFLELLPSPFIVLKRTFGIVVSDYKVLLDAIRGVGVASRCYDVGKSLPSAREPLEKMKSTKQTNKENFEQQKREILNTKNL